LYQKAEKCTHHQVARRILHHFTSYLGASFDAHQLGDWWAFVAKKFKMPEIKAGAQKSLLIRVRERSLTIAIKYIRFLGSISVVVTTQFRPMKTSRRLHSATMRIFWTW
jgi:hypothetical protein